MDYTIAPSEDGKYIVITVRGEINGESATKITLEAHALGRELGIERFLEDLTECRNLETDTHNYTFARKDLLRQKGLNYTARVALLVSPDDRSHDFVAMVTRNSGLDVRLFTDREQAVQHLLEKRAPNRITTKPENRGSGLG